MRFKKQKQISKWVILSVALLVLVGSPFFMENAQAGRYAVPTPGAKPTETVAPAVMQNTSSAQYVQPSDKQVQIGSFNDFLNAGVAGSNIGIVSQPGILQWLDPQSLRFSQTKAGGNGRAEKLWESMMKNGWKGQPIDVIRTPEGIVTFDNTRPAIARELGIDKIQARIHNLDDILPDEYADDAFWKSKGITKGSTWRDVLRIRTAAQGKGQVPLYGTTNPPEIKGVRPSIEEIQAFKNGVKTEATLVETTIKVKNPGLIEKFGNLLKAKFPQAVEAGQKFLAGAGKILVKLGPLFAVAGIVFGLLEMGYSGSRLFDLMKEEGILEALGGKEGQVAALETLAGFFSAIAGAAFLLATATAATVIGAPAAAACGTIAVVAGIVSLLFAGTALVVENWETIKETAKNVWENVKDNATKAYRWVAGSAEAAGVWAVAQAKSLMDTTKNALVKAGKIVGELARGTVQVVENIVENVTVMVPKVIHYVEDKVTQVVKTGTRMVEKVVDQVKEIIEPVVRIGERFVTKIVEVAKQVPRVIYETVTRIVDKVIPVVRQVTDYVTTKVQETYQYTTQVTRNVIETVTERVREAYEVVRQVPRQIAEWVTERVQETQQVARTVYDTVREWITERVAETYPVVTQVARTVYETVTERVRGWIGWIWGWVTRTFTRARTIYETVTTYATRYVNRAREVARQVARTIYEPVTRWVDRTRQITRTVYDTVREIVYRWVERPVQYVRQVVDTIWHTGSRLVDRVVPVVRQVTDYVTTKVQETYQVAKTVYDTVVEKVPQLVKETYEYIEQVPRAIVEKVKVLVPEEYQYTENVVEKINKTKTEMVAEVRETVKEVRKDMESWVPAVKKVGAGVLLATSLAGSVLAGGVETYSEPLQVGAAAVKSAVANPVSAGRAILKEGASIINDPIEFGKSMVDGYSEGVSERWDEGIHGKARAIGYVGADVISTIATGGTSAIVKNIGGEILEKTAKETAEKVAKEVTEGAVIQATKHGSQQLVMRGFTEAEILATKQGAKVMVQGDGAKVFLKEVTLNKFNVIVEGDNGIITALKHVDEKAVKSLTENYGWH